MSTPKAKVSEKMEKIREIMRAKPVQWISVASLDDKLRSSSQHALDLLVEREEVETMREGGSEATRAAKVFYRLRAGGDGFFAGGLTVGKVVEVGRKAGIVIREPTVEELKPVLTKFAADLATDMDASFLDMRPDQGGIRFAQHSGPKKIVPGIVNVDWKSEAKRLQHILDEAKTEIAKLHSRADLAEAAHGVRFRIDEGGRARIWHNDVLVFDGTDHTASAELREKLARMTREADARWREVFWHRCREGFFGSFLSEHELGPTFAAWEKKQREELADHDDPRPPLAEPEGETDEG